MSGKIEILCTELAQTADWTKTRYGEHVPSIPKWIEPWESLNSPKTKQFPFHLISPHPRWRTHSIFNNCSWLRETYEQEVTLNADDAKRLGVKTGDTVEIWNDRGKVVLPVYATERVMPGAAVLHEGAWLDLDDKGVDRSGNPNMLTLDAPSPAGAIRLQHRALQHPQDRPRASPEPGPPGDVPIPRTPACLSSLQAITLVRRARGPNALGNPYSERLLVQLDGMCSGRPKTFDPGAFLVM